MIPLLPLPQKELSLAEMLADPIVKAMMSRDGVTTNQWIALIDAVRGPDSSLQVSGELGVRTALDAGRRSK